MIKVIMSKYSCLIKKPLLKNFSGVFTGMDFTLPSWFTNWNKNKIIKVCCCSFNYLERENKKPILSNIYQNQFISVHSNIAYEVTITLKSKYLHVLQSNYLSNPNESTATSDFMIIVNNYYIFKIYDLTNNTIDSITTSFRGAYGELIPIHTSHSFGNPTIVDEIQQATFKTEIKLAILE
jgi:hypothetical protein